MTISFRSLLHLLPSLLTTLLLTLLTLSPALAKSSTGDSVLVIVDKEKKDDYSMFLSGLKKHGYKVTLRGPREESPTLFEYDEPSFAHVLILASDTKVFAKDITPQSLVHLLSRGTNLILTLSSKQTPLVSLAAEFGISPPPPGTPLISYFPSRPDPPSIIPISIPQPLTQNHLYPPPILSKNISTIWFSGVPHAYTHSTAPSPRLVPILRAPPESFASETDSGTPDALVDAAERTGEGLWAGSQMNLVSGFQTEGGRAAWVGGTDLFTDAFFKKEVSIGVQSDNEQFARDLTAWTFQESLVLRVDRTEHQLVNDTLAANQREKYTTNDQILYTAYISKYDSPTGTWIPYSGIYDLQLEFTMLDPHLRLPLPPAPIPNTNEKDQGKYSLAFRAPDRHGVFKFVLRWRRKGYTYLESSTTIALTPPRHDGYPRFLSAAWPYYTGALSTSLGFFLFSLVWLAGVGSDAAAPASGKGGGKAKAKAGKTAVGAKGKKAE